MGASLSQDTAYLPEEVVNNYRRSDDRDLRFRLALASHQRFYKHFDPAKLVLTEEEFVEVFSPSFVDARLHFRIWMRRSAGACRPSKPSRGVI